MSSAKSEILASIRQATGGSSAERTADYAAISRHYQVGEHLDLNGRLELFADRLRDYGSGFYCCSEPELASVSERILQARGKKRLVIPPHLPMHWLPPGFELLKDDGLDYLALDKLEGVLTGCTLAVASTGTIILRHSPLEGRRALTLIPDYHLSIVFSSQLVGTVPEAIRILDLSDPALLTTISGPSATSDIEMTRIQGVHGPRTLDVIVVLP